MATDSTGIDGRTAALFALAVALMVALVVAWRIDAEATSSPPENAYQLTLHNEQGEPVADAIVDYGETSVNIASSILVQDDQFNFDEDTPNIALPVLNNDESTLGANLTISDVSVPDQGGTVAVSQDGKSLVFSPLLDFFLSFATTHQISSLCRACEVAGCRPAD